MLEIKKLTKIYSTGSFKQKALNNVEVNFRKSEFAAILGPSGSGKTTFLNIIGGLDKYTSGDLKINGVSTRKYKDSDWDSYRNHRIGFVFQSYNLINHQSVLSNVRLALTLSGIKKSDATKKAIDALTQVGLKDHIYKKPTELSGGQMQRVAIARALVNDPDILLADEPTGALDSETSIQIMDILANIAKEKLVIMVTHNPELAKKYANRIISLKDGEITSDTNPYIIKKETKNDYKNKKTAMSFLTALSLSFNNLMTKKARTILVSLAGSIGIIGIALILSLSTGFQNYIDHIQEETLTSYPLRIMQESSDIAATLLSLTEEKPRTNDEKVVEEQYVQTMLSNISTNDLKSFKKYIEDNYSKIKDDISTIKYSYNIDPIIYSKDDKGKLTKLNPSNLFTSFTGNSSLMSSYSSYSSIYNQMMDNMDILNEQYDMLKGRWPNKYDEVIVVLSSPNSISDLLVYSLGFRNTQELSNMVTKIMSGEKVNINNEPLTLTYDDILNKEIRLIKNTDLYKYNKTYNIYEYLEDDESIMNGIYNKSLPLKIVGIVSPKEGTNSNSLSPGVNYTSALITYIINESSESSVVKKQLNNKDIDVLSNNKFDSNNKNLDFKLSDVISIDKDKIKDAFNTNIDKDALEKKSMEYIKDINASISVDTNPAYESIKNSFISMSNDILDSNDIILDDYLNSNNYTNKINELSKTYPLPSNIYNNSFKGLLSSELEVAKYLKNNMSKEDIINMFVNKEEINTTFKQLAIYMTEAKVKSEVLAKVSGLTGYLTNSFSNAFSVDQNKISSAFKMNLNEDELQRVVNAIMNKKDVTLDSNLSLLGYQDIDDPSYISFYFNSFDGKERFLDFIDDYNKKVDEEKEIKYTDTTGILMSSVKTIVNAVSYVLIAFVSISLVVSSIMIGIITYISVYERTKEIGILRAIGASKKNISSIFNAETFIIGFLAGLFGILITYALIPIINAIIHSLTGNIPLSATLSIKAALLLILLSVILTLIGGLIPSKKASKMNPVEALRSE